MHIAGLIALLLSLPSVAQAPRTSWTEAAAGAAAELPDSHSTATTGNPEEYIIGADDVLSVEVWKEPEISRILPVRPDGKITLPLIGEVQAGGMTTAELQRSVTGELSAFLAHPTVTIIVQEARSRRFKVVGEVEHPGSYPLGQPLTVLDAVALAGGFREFAHTKKMYVLRVRADGSQERIAFNYKQVITGKNLGQNIRLQPGDTVVVP